jgi:cell division protein FtsW (lipid II flippase)
VRIPIERVDKLLAALIVAIAALGLYNLASASRPMGIGLHVTHAMHLGVGLLFFLALVSLHYRHLEALAIPIFVGMIVLLVATMLVGKTVNGSRRWLNLGVINLQTSDVAKLAVILAVAKEFHQDRWDAGGMTLRYLFRPLNVSRPLLMVLVVLAASLLGDRMKPAYLESPVAGRVQKVAVISNDVGMISIGRGERSAQSARVPFRGVSPEHAQVLRRSNLEYFVRDLGKAGGTFVNGFRIEEDTDVHDGDRIRVGKNLKATLVFRSPAERIQATLPWLAIFGTIWLAAAFFVQMKKGRWTRHDIVAPIDMVVSAAVLVLVQPDLGTSLVILLIAFSMILYVGLRPISLVLFGTSSAVFSVWAWLFILRPYQKQRVLTFIDPTSDLSGAGYHQHQSLIAVGSGQLWGKGHGQGTQTQLSFLPEQQTDFIFSVWAEEQGFVGCLLLVALFLALVLRCLHLASTARDRFGTLLAVGATAMLFWHTVINMLMVLRLAPVVGVPLPFWSNGGSFAVTAMIALGMLMSVSARKGMF